MKLSGRIKNSDLKGFMATLPAPFIDH